MCKMSGLAKKVCALGVGSVAIEISFDGSRLLPPRTNLLVSYDKLQKRRNRSSTIGTHSILQLQHHPDHTFEPSSISTKDKAANDPSGVASFLFATPLTR
jgi:hypothetical protein